MASSRGGERMIHQDFIARIRFSNALPPPPNPPKLLDIPNTGLTSGQYTAPGFASRLAREQPLNIEADAELGMPLDLVGMPGVFDGDESSIQAPAHTPHVHPHDRMLLRPLSTLGKPKPSEAAVSFLRRTEYISSQQAAKPRIDSSARAFVSAAARRPEKRPVPELDKDSPEYTRRKILKTFQIAEENLADLSRVKHPTKKGVRLVDAYPMVPDLDAFPDSGTYVTIKFLTNPVAATGVYDTRILNGVFKPIERTKAEEEAYEVAAEAHERDPDTYPKPSNQMNYDFYLNASVPVAANFREKFDIDNPDRDREDLYTDNTDGGRCFQFARVRAYETSMETELNHQTKYDEELILSYNDHVGGLDQKALYYYPVMQRSNIRPQRSKNIARTIGLAVDDQQVVDQLDVVLEDPEDDMKEYLLKFKEHPHGFEEEADEEEATEESQGNDGYRFETNGKDGKTVADSYEHDAEADDDE